MAKLENDTPTHSPSLKLLIANSRVPGVCGPPRQSAGESASARSRFVKAYRYIQYCYRPYSILGGKVCPTTDTVLCFHMNHFPLRTPNRERERERERGTSIHGIWAEIPQLQVQISGMADVNGPKWISSAKMDHFGPFWCREC